MHSVNLPFKLRMPKSKTNRLTLILLSSYFKQEEMSTLCIKTRIIRMRAYYNIELVATSMTKPECNYSWVKGCPCFMFEKLKAPQCDGKTKLRSLKIKYALCLLRCVPHTQEPDSLLINHPFLTFIESTSQQTVLENPSQEPRAPANLQNERLT